jgi:hypothetical protein
MAKNYFINVPPNLDKVMADNWRTVKDALNEYTKLNTTVNSTTIGLSVAASKIKISSGDAVADYLNKKLIAGTGITLTKTNTGGMGGEILTAAIGAHADLTDMPNTLGTNTNHDVRYVTKVQTATPTTPTPYEGMRWYDTDAVGNASMSFAVVTNTYVVADEIELVVCNKATAFTVTIPVASASGRKITIKNINTGAVTVDGNGSDTIDGIANQVLSQWDALTVVDYLANAWVII